MAPATPDSQGGPRIAVAGKGGAGKSLVAGTLARLLAREGRRVLVLDSDTAPGVSFSLGADPPDDPPLRIAVRRDDGGRWRFAAGFGPVRAVQRCSVAAPEGVRLLSLGKTGPAGVAALAAPTNAFHLTVHGLERSASLREWALVGDLPAGPRQIAFDWAPYARTLLLVVEPTAQSMLTARRIRRIALARRPATEVALAVNKSAGPADARRVSRFLELPVAAHLPLDDTVHTAERAGRPLLDHAPGSPVVGVLEALAHRLHRSTMAA